MSTSCAQIAFFSLRWLYTPSYMASRTAAASSCPQAYWLGKWEQPYLRPPDFVTTSECPGHSAYEHRVAGLLLQQYICPTQNPWGQAPTRHPQRVPDWPRRALYRPTLGDRHVYIDS